MRVYDGYEAEPKWLAGHPDGYVGVVQGFVEDTNGQPAAVVALDQEITLESASTGEALRGRYLLLTFAWTGMNWSRPGPRLHVHLFQEPPTRYPSRAEFRRSWVESHASWNF